MQLQLLAAQKLQSSFTGGPRLTLGDTAWHSTPALLWQSLRAAQSWLVQGHCTMIALRASWPAR